jgi:cytosine/adenosine deaminase-related metal-dependent hydrolase
MTSRLITNVRVLDGTGREPFAGSVRVEGARLAEVSAGASLPPRPGEPVIDGRGATLMPGLIEPHAHLSFADTCSPTS